jgi:hypothetical protein
MAVLQRVKLAGALVLLSVTAVASSGGGFNVAQGHSTRVVVVTADYARSLVEKCQVSGMGTSARSGVSLVLKDGTYAMVRGEEGNALFSDTLTAQHSRRVPDRCMISFDIE